MIAGPSSKTEFDAGRSDAPGQPIPQVPTEVESEHRRHETGGATHQRQGHGEVTDDRQDEAVEEERDGAGRGPCQGEFEVSAPPEESQREAGDTDTHEPRHAPDERNRTADEEPHDGQDERDEESARRQDRRYAGSRREAGPESPRAGLRRLLRRLVAPGIAVDTAGPTRVTLAPEVGVGLAFDLPEQFVRVTHTYREEARLHRSFPVPAQRRADPSRVAAPFGIPRHTTPPFGGDYMSSQSLDGRTFRAAGESQRSGEVRFEFHEDDGVVWATYRGGPVVVGVLAGQRDGADLGLRYVQERESGRRERGCSLNRLERREDGRVRIREEVALDSRASERSPLLEEVESP